MSTLDTLQCGYSVHSGQAVGLSLRGPAALLCCCGGGGGRSDTTSSSSTATTNRQYGVSDQGVGLIAERDLQIAIESVDPEVMARVAQTLEALGIAQSDLARGVVGDTTDLARDLAELGGAVISQANDNATDIARKSLETQTALANVSAAQTSEQLAALASLGKTVSTGGASDAVGALKTVGIAAAAALALAFIVGSKRT